MDYILLYLMYYVYNYGVLDLLIFPHCPLLSPSVPPHFIYLSLVSPSLPSFPPPFPLITSSFPPIFRLIFVCVLQLLMRACEVSGQLSSTRETLTSLASAWKSKGFSLDHSVCTQAALTHCSGGEVCVRVSVCVV